MTGTCALRCERNHQCLHSSASVSIKGTESDYHVILIEACDIPDATGRSNISILFALADHPTLGPLELDQRSARKSPLAHLFPSTISLFPSFSLPPYQDSDTDDLNNALQQLSITSRSQRVGHVCLRSVTVKLRQRKTYSLVPTAHSQQSSSAHGALRKRVDG